jgi:hypothetical protein
MLKLTKRFWRVAVGAILLLCGSATYQPKAQTAGDPRGWIDAGLAAMGGEAKLRAIRTIHLEGIGYKHALEQSERPEGPWIVQYQTLNEFRDPNHNQLRRSQTNQIADYKFTQTTILSDGAVATAFNEGKLTPGKPGAEEWLALAPERVLLTAKDAGNSRSEPDRALQGVRHHRFVFLWRGIPVHVYLNSETNLLTCVELTRPYLYDYFEVWGDVTTRVFYSFWSLKPGGLHYPVQWDVQQNDLVQSSLFLSKVEFDASLPSGAFEIPEAVKAAYLENAKKTDKDLKLGRPDQPIAEVAAGIFQIPGSFNTNIIKQEDGLVILETPVSSAYSTKVIEEAQRCFPGAPIKAAITTSDAWPHIGGAREYVARGIPIYVLDLNVPIIDRLLSAPRHSAPDGLALKPRKPILRKVSNKTVLGSGPNRIELYPIRTETGERMMMAYFPEHHLLYASDLAQPFDNGTWIPQYLFELNAAVKREQLTVDRAFAMHLRPFAWSDLLAVIMRTVENNPK